MKASAQGRAGAQYGHSSPRTPFSDILEVEKKQVGGTDMKLHPMEAGHEYVYDYRLQIGIHLGTTGCLMAPLAQYDWLERTRMRIPDPIRLATRKDNLIDPCSRKGATDRSRTRRDGSAAD
jgi:hypothetical protein